jgi:hypothetical protein
MSIIRKKSISHFQFYVHTSVTAGVGCIKVLLTFIR